MAIQIKHAFTSAKGDGTDATLVRPSNWNAVHTTSMATAQLLGRLTAGVGAFEEIPVSAFIASILNTADLATLIGLVGGAETGDVKYTFKQTASAGWLLVAAAGSIGDASSSGTLRANADCSALFTVLYALSDALAPVSGGRGANAAADFAAHKNIGIPQLVGRSPIAAGAAAGVTTLKALGTLYGEESTTLTSAQIPAHTHPNSLNESAHSHTASNFFSGGAGGGGVGGGGSFGVAVGGSTSANVTGITITNAANTGGGGSHNSIHPVVGLNAMVKL